MILFDPLFLKLSKWKDHVHGATSWPKPTLTLWEYAFTYTGNNMRQHYLWQAFSSYSQQWHSMVTVTVSFVYFVFVDSNDSCIKSWGRLSEFHILVYRSCRAIVIASPPLWSTSAGIPSAPGSLLDLSNWMALCTSSKVGGSSGWSRIGLCVILISASLLMEPDSAPCQVPPQCLTMQRTGILTLPGTSDRWPTRNLPLARGYPEQEHWYSDVWSKDSCQDPAGDQTARACF